MDSRELVRFPSDVSKPRLSKDPIIVLDHLTVTQGHAHQTPLISTPTKQLSNEMAFIIDNSMKLTPKIMRGFLVVCAFILASSCGLISRTNQPFVDAFVVVQQQPAAVPGTTLTGSRLMMSRAIADADDGASDTAPNKESSVITRRQVFTKAASAVMMSALAVTQNTSPSTASAGGIGTSPESPIVVLGGGGKVGKLCTQILASKGLYVRCTTRSGRPVLDGESQYVSYAPCDVTSDKSLAEALKGSSGCIFAASSSGKKKGGDPIDVDYVGCYKTAQACLAAKVPKLVVVSSGTVTRPDSAGFKATNFFIKVRGSRKRCNTGIDMLP